MAERFFVLSLLLFAGACGQSIEELKFYQAARRQFALENDAMTLFTRGPTWDAADLYINARSNINAVPKSFVPLYELASQDGPLLGYYEDGLGYGIKVQYTSTNSQSPVFSKWAGNEINWNSKEFKAFMLYAHLSKAKKEALKGISDLDTRFQGASVKYDLKAIAAESGNALDANFYFLAGGDPTITFYQHNSGNNLSTLNFADEADAIYHEYAHYIQNFYNGVVIGSSKSDVKNGQINNPDLDAVIEGTADYFTMAVTKSEKIHAYLENNMPLVLEGRIVREGTHNRSYSRSWGFPETYILQEHFDGRVVSAAVNDLRKYLQGQDVAIRNCTPVGDPSCFVSLSGKVSGVEDMWMKAFELSMLAFEDSGVQTTYRGYFKNLMTETASFVTANGCGGCAAEVRSDLLALFAGRGLIEADTASVYTTAIAASKIGTAADDTIRMGASFNFVPFAISSGKANGDAKLSECEIAVVMPDLTNNSNLAGPRSDFYNIHFRMKSFSNLQEVKYTDNTIVDPLTGSEQDWKFWGILKPTEKGANKLLTSGSGWYTVTNGSHFSKPATLDNYPVSWGYMITVPRNRAGATISITWEIILQPKFSDTNAAKTTFESTQTLVIDTDSAAKGFCS